MPLQVPLAQDVVTVKDAPGLVPADLHGYALRDPGPDHVADRRAPEVMEQPAREPCRLARGFPSPPKVSDRLPVPVEDPRDRAALLLCQGAGLVPQSAQGGPQTVGQDDGAPLAVLGSAGIKSIRPGPEVHPIPCQAQDFRLAPAERIGEREDVIQWGR